MVGHRLRERFVPMKPQAQKDPSISTSLWALAVVAGVAVAVTNGKTPARRPAPDTGQHAKPNPQHDRVFHENGPDDVWREVPVIAGMSNQ
jgi:hypothetical protein